MLMALGCSTTKNLRDERVAEYRMITRDVCIDNETEVLLAQHLYNYMFNQNQNQ